MSNKLKYREDVFKYFINEMKLEFAAEIGVDTGKFSEHLLDSSLKKLYCIDSWMDNFGSNCRPDYFDEAGEKRFKEAEERLKKFGEKVTFIRKLSLDAVEDFKDGCLDFVYIDGDHSLEGIYEDIRAWTPKVKIGGVVAGHDYKDGPRSGMKDFYGNQLDYKVKTIVDDYIARMGYELGLAGGVIKSWYFVKDK